MNSPCIACYWPIIIKIKHFFLLLLDNTVIIKVFFIEKQDSLPTARRIIISKLTTNIIATI
jgi:hypothetical protein